MWQETGFGKKMTEFYTKANSKEEKEDWAREISS
jgi:hypothetical protein